MALQLNKPFSRPGRPCRNSAVQMPFCLLERADILTQRQPFAACQVTLADAHARLHWRLSRGGRANTAHFRGLVVLQNLGAPRQYRPPRTQCGSSPCYLLKNSRPCFASDEQNLSSRQNSPCKSISPPSCRAHSQKVIRPGAKTTPVASGCFTFIEFQPAGSG